MRQLYDGHTFFTGGHDHDFAVFHITDKETGASNGVLLSFKSGQYGKIADQIQTPSAISIRERIAMAGHSKWANIKHKKAATDAKRGKVWTRLIKEITVGARLGGGDVTTNPRLRLAVEKAADANMPKDNVQRAIQRGTGGLDGANYEEIRYEGYGINGAAVLVDCMTDNRVRTVAEVRHAFAKFGGNMGSEGSVAFLFKHCGQFLFAPGTNEDALMEAALEAGAEDVVTDDEGGIEVLCGPNDFSTVKDALEKAGYKAEVAEIIMKPTTETVFNGDDAIKMQKLLDALENLDDVQEIYTNAIIEE
jgi:YebC/PmpR family DNA-binding regulatory protein